MFDDDDVDYNVPLLTLAQTVRLASYTPRDLSILSAIHGFPHPWDWPDPPSCGRFRRPMWNQAEVDNWVVLRNTELFNRLL